MSAAQPPTRNEVHIAICLTAISLFFVFLLMAVVIDPRNADFTGYYMAGLIVREGNSAKLYDLREQARIQAQLFGRKNLLINPHPPFEALCFAALARLSYVKAYVLWGAINVLLWLLSQNLIWRHTPIPLHPNRYLLFCSLFLPLWGALVKGQTTVVLLALFSLTFVCLKRGQDLRAGACLGLGLFKFPIVLPFVFICFLRSKWKLMAGFAAVAFVLGLLSVIAVGPVGVHSYMNLLIDMVRNPDNPAYGTTRYWESMPTVRGLFATLFKGQIATVYLSVLAAAVSAPLLFFTAWRWRQEDRDRRGNAQGLMFAAALTISQVTAHHLYTYDLTLMLLVVPLVVSSPQWTEKSQQRKVLTAAIMILFFPPVYVLLTKWKAMCILAPVLVAIALGTISLARKTKQPTPCAMG